MKKTLYIKMFSGYLLFGILGFLLVSTYTTRKTYDSLLSNEASSLYTQAVQVASDYGKQYFNSKITMETFRDSLSVISSYHHTDIWIVGTDGRLLTCAQQSAESPPTFIRDFDITAFSPSFYQTGNFFGYFSQDYVTVYAPVTVNYVVRAYVFIHEPVNNISTLSNKVLNVSYLSLVCIFVLSFGILLLFTIIVYLPIKKITKAAVEYSTGNFIPQINVHSNDEIGYLAKTLNFMSHRLATSEEDQRKFIANISHDFRSPLTSIKGYIEAILDGTIPPELQSKYLTIVLTESERLTKLTNSLLDLNKCGSHGALLEISSFDINQVIRSIGQSCEGQCQAKRIRLSLILTGNTLFVTADVGKIQQVIYNLLDNAIKFSHSDSVITIETTCKNDRLLVSVKDTGIGIPKNSLTDIWNRFYKTDLSRGKDKKGTGLGLSIVKEIIQAHGETINVISTEGVGTEFIFSLRLSEEQSTEE